MRTPRRRGRGVAGRSLARWLELGRFPLHVETMAYAESYITYSNQQHVWLPGIVEEAAAAQGLLRREWRVEPLPEGGRHDLRALVRFLHGHWSDTCVRGSWALP